MHERSLQIGPYAWDVSQILRLAVADVEPGENTEDLACALGCERDVGADESGGVELAAVGTPVPDVAAEQRHLGLLRHVDAGVLQERSEVVGGRPNEGVLEVEEANPLELAAIGQPEQVR